MDFYFTHLAPAVGIIIILFVKMKLYEQTVKRAPAKNDELPNQQAQKHLHKH